MVDRVVERHNLKNTLHYLLYVHSSGRKQSSPGKNETVNEKDGFSSNEKSAWEKVKMVRSGDRATSMDYIERIIEDFRELHGDCCFGDDHALIGGLALIGGQAVTVLANLRGKSMQERFHRNFGMPKPEGYPKAIRLMKQSEKFGHPVIAFINTSGAFCGIDAEERGQGTAIAESIMTMAALKVPTLCILVGEGRSAKNYETDRTGSGSTQCDRTDHSGIWRCKSRNGGSDRPSDAERHAVFPKTLRAYVPRSCCTEPL